MPRLTNKLFTDLAIWMTAFGLVIGLCFPFLATLLGIAREQAFTPMFFAATVAAGLLAGALNFLLARLVVRPHIRMLADHMHMVEQAIRGATFEGDWSGCSTDHCRVPVDSYDELGEAAMAFNDLVEALFRAHEVETAVTDFSNALSSQLELDALTRQALALLIQHTGSLAGVVLIESQGELRVAAQHGLRNPERMIDSDHIRQAMRSGDCGTVEVPEEVRIEALLADFRPREILVVPIQFKNSPLGAVVLAGTEPFSGDAQWLVQLFRQGFGLALNNALAHERLQRIAALDVLTGVYNRRFGLSRLHEEFNRAVRGNTPLGLLIFDLDHFKSINDTYGHLVGDRVLTRVAESAHRAMREGDILVRYGGEEFLGILPGASCNDTQLVAERLRRIIEETNVKDGEQTIVVTVSVGITSFPQDDVDDENQLIQDADEALYAAKRQGRNRVVLAR
ncbi:GGDEF domain-containing protein [Endothiovibrio diazotrophicus]